MAARPGWADVPAVRDGELHEVKSPLILQPGPAALTDGLDRLRAVTDDAHLAAFLDRAVVAPLPHLDEDFPERLYGT